MAKYRKKPVIIEAVCLLPEFKEMIKEHIGKTIPIRIGFDKKMFLLIPTLEGEMKASEGDYIIRGVSGELYPCKPEIFHATYEEV